MKTTITLLAIFTAIFVLSAHNKGYELPPIPILGTYPNTTIVAGTNTSVTPSVQPSFTTKMVAYTNTNFTGILTVNPVTGIVTITNAKQAGDYTITVKAFDNGGLMATRTFTLRVTNPIPSQGLFTNNTNISVRANPSFVAIGDFNEDGKQDLVVTGATNTATTLLGDGLGNFSNGNTIQVGSDPKSIAVGDFNGDGRQDLVIANAGSNNVSIRIGNGRGGFRGTTNISVGSSPISVVLGDFNNDGLQDFATANAGSNNVSIRLGDGNGGFSGNTTVSIGGSPTLILVGDFNGDGKQDIVTHCACYAINPTANRFGDGLGNFTEGPTVSVGMNPISAALSDFNGDGIQDLATANSGSNTVSVRLGNSSGGFSGSTEVNVGSSPTVIVVGDFNGDGKQDFVTHTPATGTAVNPTANRFGDGLGNFSGYNDGGGVGETIYSMAVGDFNGDGIQDIASANFNSSTVSIRLGGVNEINVQGNGVSIVDGDVTPSASDDTYFGTVISGSHLVRTYTVQNTGAGNLTVGALTVTGTNASLFTVGALSPGSTIAPGSAATFTVTFAPTSLGLKTATVHIANDDSNEADYDFAIRGIGIQSPLTLGNYPNTTLIAGTNTKITPNVAPTNAVRMVAYTHTNFTGIFTVNPATGIVTVTDAKQAGVYLVTVKAFSSGGLMDTKTFTLTVTNPSCSQGLFTGTTNVAVGNNPTSVAIGDFNGDGKQDFAAANYGSNTVSIHLGNGLGGFSSNTNISVGLGPYFVAIGDFNGDGNQDFVTANANSNNVSIRLGNGIGGFSGNTSIPVGFAPVCVAIGDFNGDGNQDLTVANSGGNNNVSICLGNGNGSFSGSTSAVAGNNPKSYVAIGDFNGDGKQDLATTNRNSNTVSLHLGNGSGGFSGNTNLIVGNNPFSTAVGDFNGDGKQDLATTAGSNNVSISLGNGSGGFSGSTNVLVGFGPQSVAIGDFNGDGKQDFVTDGAFVSLRFGDGSGGFSGNTNVPGGNASSSVAMGDFNGDGKQDIVATNYNNNNVFIGLGSSNEINVQGNGISIADGDYTPVISDHTDIGQVNVGNNAVRTFTVQNTGTSNLNLGSITVTGTAANMFTLGALNPASPITPGTSATFTLTFSPSSAGLKTATIQIANDDCDEAVYDFAVQGTGIQAPLILGTYPNTTLVAGTNTKITPGVAPTNAVRIVAYTHTNFTGIITVNPVTGVLTVTDAKQAGIYAVTVKAFDNGGFTTTSTFTLTVTNPNCSQGFFSGTTNVATGNIPQSVAIGDFNGDGKQDFATANVGSNTVSIRLGDGLGGFAGTTNVAMGTGPQSVAIGDFNGDGRQDLATANLGSNTVSIRLGNGLGGFTGTTNVAVGVQPISVAIGDFNGDGQQDFATANYSSASVSIRLGDGLGGFSGTTTVAVGNAPRSVAIGDFNGDGKQDFAAANLSSNTVSIRLGNGLGGFSGTTNVAVGNGPRSLAIGDFNGDGKQDFATANPASNTVSIRLGNGLGGFSGTANLAVGVQPISIVIGDFNGDGKQDFATANNGSNTVSIQLGNGLGGFSGTTSVATGTGPQSVAIGDFNSDGKQDFATANNGSNSVSIRLGGSNEINVQGNGASIVDGDNTPVISDHTDFGNITSGSNLVRSYTVQNTGTVNLTLGAITITGVHASLFTLGPLSPASPIAPGSAATFTVTFAPSSAGLKTATVHIANDDCDEADYDFALQGIGICNPPVFSTCPALQTVTAANGSCTASVTYAATVSGIPTPTLSYAFSGATTASNTGTGSGLPFNIGITNVVITAANACGTTSCSFTITVKAPEINVQGNGASIADGDVSPTPSDHSDFGNVTSGSNLVRSYTVQNTGTVNLTLGAINITGVDASLFTLGPLSPASPIAPGGTATFTLTFAPSTAGLKTATVHIANDDCNEADYDFAVQGTGVVSSPILGTYPNISLVVGTNTKITPSVAPTNAVSIVAYSNTNFTGILTVNAATGIITITDAKQAGVYTVTVKAFGSGGLTATRTFTLTVTNPNCSQGLFTGTTNVGVGNVPYSVAVGDFNGDGSQDFATANLGSNTVSIQLGDGLGGFSGTTNVAVGNDPRFVAIGDFNGDGKQDFIVANYGSNTVSIRLGDGLGGFSGTTDVVVESGPYSVAVGDFNGDGKQDFAAANFNSNTVSIRLGDGLGDFSGTTNVAVEIHPYSVALGDFNGDGKQDIAAANYNNSTVSIRLGDGLGNFSGTTNVAVGSGPYSVAIGDFNGDGKQDFATANNNPNTVSIRLGDGLGSFSGTTNVVVGSGPLSVAIGDFNGDGKQDFAAANFGSNTVSIGLGDGLGGFSGTTNVAVGNAPRSVAIGDFNGDGKQDIATANYNSNTVSIRLGGSNKINVQGNGASIADGDVSPTTSDHSDFGNVTSGSNLVRSYTVQNTGTVNLTLGAINITGVDASLFTLGALSPASPIAPGNSATFTLTFSPSSAGLKTATVHIANDDCDEADYDFAVQGTGVVSSPILGTYPNTSLVAGTNVKITPSAVPINAVSIVAYTNTNFTGTLFVNPTTGVLTVTDANQVGVYSVTVKAFGTGGFQTTSVFTLTVIPSTCSQFASTGSSPVPVGDYPLAIAIGDFNNDGLQDIATANSNNFNHSVSIRMGDGTGSFTGNTTIPVGEDPYSVAIGDFNGDGKQDFATANYTSNSVSIRLGNGSGGFSGSTEIPVGGGAYGAYAVAIGDFNGDGKQDIAAANGTDGTVLVLIGDGSGGFSVTATLSVGSSPSFVAIGDFNADSYQDLAVVNVISNSVSILLGNGIGNFTASPYVPIGGLPVGSFPYSVAIGDFNGDNLQDLAVANIQDKSISIRLGDGLGGFSGSLNIPALAFPYIVAIADFNSDNKQDIAFSNSGGFDNTISIRFGDGSGSFSGNTNVPIDNNLSGFAVGDLNNDGKLDLVAANYNVATVSSRLGEANEINVQGNSTTITAGDATPNLADHTDFGAITAGSNLVRTFTIQNTANASLSIDAITMSGPNAALFTASAITPVSPIPAGNSATFSVTFKPLTAGTKLATVTIANDDCDEASYDFAIQGEGLGNCVNPTFTLCPSAQTVTTPTGFCAVAVSYTATATGTSTPTFSYLFSGATTGSGSGTGSGSSFNIGITNVVITATDNCGSNTCLFTITVKSPEIDVQGNSISIVKGDFSPDLADLTDFGSVIVGSKLVQTFTIQNTGNANLIIYDIEVIGLDAALFIVDPLSPASPILPGNSASFTITFKPTTTGLKTTTVYISNNTCNEGDYDFTIQGKGVPAFAPVEESSLTVESSTDELNPNDYYLGYSVYPNPANNEIIVKLENANLRIHSARILDASGKILAQKEVDEHQATLDVRSLPSGLYLIKIETNEGKTGIRKFVKSN